MQVTETLNEGLKRGYQITVTADELTFDGHDLLTMDKRARRKIVGNDLAKTMAELKACHPPTLLPISI